MQDLHSSPLVPLATPARPTGGEIYKLKLDGTIVGRFGRAGKPLKEFGSMNSLDCRSENTLLVGEAANMSVPS